MFCAQGVVGSTGKPGKVGPQGKDVSYSFILDDCFLGISLKGRPSQIWSLAVLLL